MTIDYVWVCIELWSIVINQHVFQKTEILPLATSYIANCYVPDLDYIAKRNKASQKWIPFQNTRLNLDIRPIHQKWQHLKDCIVDTVQHQLLQLHKTICSLWIYAYSSDQLALSACACTACPKHTRKICHFDPSCLGLVQHNTSLPNMLFLFWNRFSFSTLAIACRTLYRLYLHRLIFKVGPFLCLSLLFCHFEFIY